MFILAKLVFESYMPEKLTKGMMFKQRIKDVIYGKIYEYDRIFELNHTPQDELSYLSVNGYPVRPRVMSLTANPDTIADTIATYDKIGWWDDGPEFDDLRDVTIADFNYILSDEDGIIEIEVNIIDDNAFPVLYMDKCTIRVTTDEEEDDYEDWDDMDDLTDADHETE